MKRILLLLLTGTVIYISSCTKEDNNSTGDPCDKFIDTWHCKETIELDPPTHYDVDISKDPSSSSKVFLDGFFGLGLGKGIYATASGQTLTISNEVLEGYTFNGTGTISSNNNSISWSFTVDDTNGPQNVTATYTRF